MTMSTRKPHPASSRKKVAIASDTNATTPKKMTFEKENQNPEYEKMTVVQLQSMMKERGIKSTGRKLELIERLKARDDDSASLKSEDDFESMTSETSSIVDLGNEIIAITTTTDTTKALPPATPVAILVPAPKDFNAPVAAAPSAIKSNSPAPSIPATPVAAGPTPGGGISNTSILASPVPGSTSDVRSLKVRYFGRAPDTIQFDVADKLATENVAAMLRNLYPDEKINLEPKIDVEPVYLLDEYNEIHVLTLGFLQCCPTANDPPSPVYRVGKGPLPTQLDENKIKRYTMMVVIGVTIVQIVLAVLIFGFKFVFGGIPRISTVDLFRGFGFGWPAAFAAALAHMASWFVACAYFSVAFRFGVKWWFPRLAALRVDVTKAYVAFRAGIKKRKDGAISRIKGQGRPLPARFGLGIRACWTWMITKQFFTSSIVLRTREVIPEAAIIIVLTTVASSSAWLRCVLLAVAFCRPSIRSMGLFFRGELFISDLVTEIIYQSIRVPGFERSLAVVARLPPVPVVQIVGTNDSGFKLKWKAPNQIPEVLTTSETSPVPVGISAYIVRVRRSVDDKFISKTESAAPQRNFARTPTVEELVFAATAVAFPLLSSTFAGSFHPALAATLFVLIGYSITMQTVALYPPSGALVDLLSPDTEYRVTVAAVDGLNREGLESVSVTFRTKQKTLFRRLLIASEEVGIKTSAAPSNGVAGIAPPAISATRGHVRYAGVVWNLPMDEKECEYFLRTIRSASLPEPRKEKFEADFVFSTSSKSVHQVVTPSYLRTLGAVPFIQGRMTWNTDPLLIAHPPGTRHSFAAPTIYEHLPILSRVNVDRVVMFFMSGVVLTYARQFTLASQQSELDRFWHETHVELVRFALQTLLLSNVMVVFLKFVNLAGGDYVATAMQRVKNTLRTRIVSVLDNVAPEESIITRTLTLIGFSFLACATALALFGIFSFSGLALTFVVVWMTGLGMDARVVPTVRENIRDRAAVLVQPFVDAVPRFVPRGVALLAVASAFASIFWNILPVNVFLRTAASGVVFLFLKFAGERPIVAA